MTGTVEIISLSKQDLQDIIRQTAREVLEDFRADLVNSKVPSIMSKAEVAEYLGRSVPSINRLMKKRAIPFEKVDNEHPKFYKSAIDRWLHKGTKSI